MRETVGISTLPRPGVNPYAKVLSRVRRRSVDELRPNHRMQRCESAPLPPAHSTLGLPVVRRAVSDPMMLSIVPRPLPPAPSRSLCPGDTIHLLFRWSNTHMQVSGSLVYSPRANFWSAGRVDCFPFDSSMLGVEHKLKLHALSSAVGVCDGDEVVFTRSDGTYLAVGRHGRLCFRRPTPGQLVFPRQARFSISCTEVGGVLAKSFYLRSVVTHQLVGYEAQPKRHAASQFVRPVGRLVLYDEQREHTRSLPVVFFKRSHTSLRESEFIHRQTSGLVRVSEYYI
ncbi:hypothetical protein SPRG_03251 [Saprolegnia parasitica CBS 223.65]|uniref:Uncharacterized protein n=1 Tax=Saprolegnia parasitica (strain CBS 223.65) TaxID=695850 RepID=A0A067CND8_SAPPC|nr:hypothetical protein SPRG_03251 [Saprolegnia parasitica CBS 223.65]KDO32033.1 hypothetical protein SPRG_03251 [Saprolegnia parasitica CBS 223.65]|eukprot:XP_012197222.1 hypothetical protein SPRG_03251 [Saprolegnia parasitica CBS 223.65]